MTKTKASMSDSKRFYNFTKVLFIFCQVVGLAPVLQKKSLIRYAHGCWCFAILGFIYYASFEQAVYTSRKRGLPTIEKIFYLSEFVTNCAILSFAIASGYYFTDYYRSLPTILNQIHQDICNKLQTKRSIYAVLHRELCIMCLIVGGFLGICILVNLIFQDAGLHGTWQSSGAHVFTNVLISICFCQYWLGLRYLCGLYEHLNVAIEDLLKTADVNAEEKEEMPLDFVDVDTTMPFTPGKAWFQREFSMHTRKLSTMCGILDYARLVYYDLDEVLSKFVSVFSFVIVLNFLGSFLDLAIQFFAVYKFAERLDYDHWTFVYKILWIASHLGRIIFILILHNTIIREKCRTCLLINEFNAGSKGLDHSLNRFLMQMMVRKSTESACGVVDLDLLFIGGLISALSTYIIFLIQIDLGNESLASTSPNKY